MAVFQVRIARARVKATVVAGASLDVNALGVIQSRQVGQYTHYTSSEGTSATIPELPMIPGSLMPAGTKWLLYAGASIGSGDTVGNGMVRAFARSGPDTFLEGWAECVTHGTPESQRGTFMAKWMVYTSLGQDLTFAISNTQGNSQPQPDGNPEGVMIQGAVLIAVPLDDFTMNQTGGDYWSSAPEIFSGAIELSNATTTYGTVRTTGYDVTQDGTYLVLASAEVNIPYAEAAKARLMVDGVQRNGEWIKYSADSRDVHSFCEAEVVTLTAGSHTFTIEGAAHSGGGAKVFKRSSLVLLRLDAFGSYAFYKQATTDVSSPYPSYTDITTLSYTPYVSGEYALVIGNGLFFRNDAAAFSARVYDKTLDDPFGQEFTSTCHPGEALVSGSIAERTSLMTVGAKLINTETQFALQGSVEAGYSNNMRGSGSWPAFLLIIGCTKRIGPATVVINAFETVGVAETSSNPLEGSWAVASENVTVSENGTVQAIQTGGSFPLTHPRLWIYNTNRLEYWRSCANAVSGLKKADWDNFLDAREYGDYPWHYAMRYIVTGNTTYRDQCVGALISEKNAKLFQVLNALSGDQWQNARAYVRSWALCYDWLYDYLSANYPELIEYLEDCLLACIYVLYHDQHDSIARIICPFGSSTNAYHLGVAEPNQNFCSTYHFMAMYAAAALGPGHKTTFRATPGDNTSLLVDFQIQFNFVSPSEGPKPWYSDLMEFVRDRYDYKLYPVWQTNYAGGGWNEGSAYGVGVGMFQGEVQALFQALGWTDTFDPLNITFYKQVGYYHLYQSQPRNLMTASYGEAAGGAAAYVADYMRHALMTVAYNYNDSLIQWWLNHVFVNMTSSETNSERPYDLLLGTRDLPEVDYRTQLPTHYHSQGIGFFNTRSSWNDDAVSICFKMGILIRDHADEDIGSLLIFKDLTGAGRVDDGFSLTDPSYYFGGGTHVDHVQYHNTYSLYESTESQDLGAGNWWRQRFTDYSPASNPGIKRNYGTAAVAYAKGDAQDIFWQTKTSQHGGTLRRQINDVFQREIFHVKAGSYLVVYDRFRVLPTYARADTNAQAHWHWTRTQPTQINSTTFRHDNAVGARVYQRIFNGGTIGFSDVSGTLGTLIPIWQQRIDHLLPSGNMWDITLFEICDNPAKGAMTGASVFPVTGLGFTPGTMRGVTINETVRMHFAFSAEQDGATPSSISYYVAKNNDSDKHYVADLVPGQEYLVTEVDLGSGYFRYTFIPTFSTGLLTNSAGVLEFTPNDISNQGVLNIYANEVVPGPVESGGVSGPTGIAVQNDPEIVSVAESASVETGITAVVINASEVIPGPVETVTPGFGVNGNESVSVVESGKITAVGTGWPGYVEKIITPNTVIMIPVSDGGATFVTPEPSDGIYFNKINDASPNTFIRFGPGINSALQSNLYSGLTTPGPYVGNVTAVRFTAYFRYVEVSGSTNPQLILNLVGSLQGQNYVQYNMPLVTVDENTPTTIQSGWIACNIPATQLTGMRLRQRARVTTFQNLEVHLYYITAEVRGPSAQKVIS